VAAEIKSAFPKIDVLINNAGLNPVEYRLTEDGFETAWATNYLAYFLLTNRLLDQIRKSANAQIINTASMAEQFGKMYWDDMIFKNEKFTAIKAYSQSKLANVMFTFRLAALLGPEGIRVNAIHPGLVSSGFGKRWQDVDIQGDVFCGADRLVAGKIPQKVFLIT